MEEREMVSVLWFTSCLPLHYNKNLSDLIILAVEKSLTCVQRDFSFLIPPKQLLDARAEMLLLNNEDVNLSFSGPRSSCWARGRQLPAAVDGLKENISASSVLQPSLGGEQRIPEDAHRSAGSDNSRSMNISGHNCWEMSLLTHF